MKLLLISNSTNYKEEYLSWCMPLISNFLDNEPKNILFLPYAGVKVGGKNFPKSYDAYAERVSSVFKRFGLHVKSIHEEKNPVEAVNNAEVIMAGGGNTFHLVYELHKNKLIAPIRKKVMEGAPFLGWSAGANIACPTLRTTNDMPIIMPESFDCLDFVPFQINPHYIDPTPEEILDMMKHGGESREDRIREFLSVNQNITVAGLREASALWVEKDMITLKGARKMKVMRHEQPDFEIEPEAKFDFSFKY